MGLLKAAADEVGFGKNNGRVFADIGLIRLAGTVLLANGCCVVGSMMVTPVAEKSPVRHCEGGVKVWIRPSLVPSASDRNRR